MLFDPPLMGTKQQLFHQRPPSPHILVTKSSFDIAESFCGLFKALALRPPPPETQAGQLQPPPPTPSGGLVNGGLSALDGSACSGVTPVPKPSW